MFQNACRKSQNVPEWIQNVAECYRMHAECSRMHPEYSRMHAECSRIHYISLHAVTWACMQLHELACSYTSLHAVHFFVWAAHKNFAMLVSITLFRLTGVTNSNLKMSGNVPCFRQLLKINSNVVRFSLKYMCGSLKVSYKHHGHIICVKVK